jgi:hypothetical protein
VAKGEKWVDAGHLQEYADRAAAAPLQDSADHQLVALTHLQQPGVLLRQDGGTGLPINTGIFYDSFKMSNYKYFVNFVMQVCKEKKHTFYSLCTHNVPASTVFDSYVIGNCKMGEMKILIDL